MTDPSKGLELLQDSQQQQCIPAPVLLRISFRSLKLLFHVSTQSSECFDSSRALNISTLSLFGVTWTVTLLSFIFHHLTLSLSFDPPLTTTLRSHQGSTASPKPQDQIHFQPFHPSLCSLFSTLFTTTTSDMDPAAFFATSATAKSFLDFPNEVRNRIYRLAIADHDRSAVYLPRLAPRKVTPKEDLSMKYGSIWEEEGEAPTEYYFYPGEEGSSLASGDWKFGKADSPVVDNDEGADGSLTEANADDEEFWNEMVRNIDYGGRKLDDAATEDLCGGEQEDYPCLCSCHDALFVGQERSNSALDCSGASDEEPCYCICYDRAPADKEGELVVGECEPPVLRDQHAPDACLRNECHDDEC